MYNGSSFVETFDGSISQVRFYDNIKLSEEEIKLITEFDKTNLTPK
jgi:hypothetical protein